MTEPLSSGDFESRRYRFGDRWHIAGTFTTRAPMHIGSGDPTFRNGLINEKTRKPCEVQGVTLDSSERACIPGSAIKGTLRSWADASVIALGDSVNRIFGEPDFSRELAESGRAEFLTAFVDPGFSFPSVGHIPFWDPKRLTGVANHVCINRATGAAEPEKLFFEEYVPRGVRFNVHIFASGLAEDDVRLLLAVMKRGAEHSTHPYQFGANGADGWGRVDWDGVVEVTRIKKSGISLQSLSSLSTLKTCEQVQKLKPLELTDRSVAHAALDLTLTFPGPFLVNDASKTKPRDAGEDDQRPNFAPLRHPDGTVWLPASSFRGAVRQRAEFLLRSLDAGASGDPGKPPGSGPIERIFGETARSSRLTIEEFTEEGDSDERQQDFVAIDRFTGGAAARAKFKATYAERPTVKTRVVLDIEGLNREDVALLALVLRDVCQGRVAFGFGGGKGYGEARGELKALTLSGAPPSWNVPPCATNGSLDPACVAWLTESLRALAKSGSTLSATVATSNVTPQASQSGTLSVAATKSGKVEYKLIYKREGKEKNLTIGPADVAPDLRDKPASGLAVDFVFAGTKPARIRRAGEEWPSDAPAPHPSAVPDHFVHPYYFLPLVDRSELAGKPLGDDAPIGHERLQPDRYTGTIRVRLTTKTPLLVCDDENVSDDNGHKTYSMRTDSGQPDGKPLVMSSSVRGMLRSAYEAITNSRFGVFPFKADEEDLERRGHARRFGYRMEAGEGLSLVPVRVEQGRARLMLGENSKLPFFDTNKNRWVIPQSEMYAAWVSRYVADCWAMPLSTPRVGGKLPLHRSEAWCWLEKIHHRQPAFSFWMVRSMAPYEAGLGTTAPPQFPGTGNYRSLGICLKRRGYFCITNQNINRKHDERFFFGPSAELLPIDDGVRARYRDLVRDYQSIHADEVAERNERRNEPDDYLGGEPGHTAFSQHVYQREALELGDGTLCYARVDERGGPRVITALYPVIISRKPFDRSPVQLLPPKLRPATKPTELSPADRVFGWVSQDPTTGAADQAYRGQIRVGAVDATSAQAVVPFQQAVPLAILGQPKPAQVRFYLGDSAGARQEKGISKEDAGYRTGNRIRGPKIYPHHTQFVETQGDARAEWVRRPNAQRIVRDKQNRSITGWVRPRAQFELDLQLENLSHVELGALVWLLSLPPEHFLRMGLGKPLGFGSVQAEIVAEKTCVAEGASWAARLSTWDSALPNPSDLDAMKAAFVAAINAANPALLSSFLRAAAGFEGMPVHYPRLKNQSPGAGENYEWFVENERGSRASLPDLLGDHAALPLL